jgi:hypothetical protein
MYVLKRLSGIGVDTGRMVVDLSGGGPQCYPGRACCIEGGKGATCPVLVVHVTVMLLTRYSFYSLLSLSPDAVQRP